MSIYGPMIQAAQNASNAAQQADQTSINTAQADYTTQANANSVAANNANQGYNPYIQSGQAALTTLNNAAGQNGQAAASGAFQQFLNSGNAQAGGYSGYDPTQSSWANFAKSGPAQTMFGDLSSGSPSQAYDTSSGYNYLQQQMTQAQNQAASAGGYLNSPQLQQYLQQNANGLAAQNFNNWSNQVLGQYNNQYMAGIQNQYGNWTNQLNNLNSQGYSGTQAVANNTMTAQQMNNTAYQNMIDQNTKATQAMGAAQSNADLAAGQAQVSQNMYMANLMQQQKSNSVSGGGGTSSSPWGSSMSSSSSGQKPPGYGIVGGGANWTPQQQAQAAALDAGANLAGGGAANSPGAGQFDYSLSSYQAPSSSYYDPMSYSSSPSSSLNYNTPVDLTGSMANQSYNYGGGQTYGSAQQAPSSSNGYSTSLANVSNANWGSPTGGSDMASQVSSSWGGF